MRSRRLLAGPIGDDEKLDLNACEGPIAVDDPSLAQVLRARSLGPLKQISETARGRESRADKPLGPREGLASTGGGERKQTAASVSTRRRQEADRRRDGPAGQSQLAATPAETRSRPGAAVRPLPCDRSHQDALPATARWYKINTHRTKDRLTLAAARSSNRHCRRASLRHRLIAVGARP